MAEAHRFIQFQTTRISIFASHEYSLGPTKPEPVYFGRVVVLEDIGQGVER